jgi:hypothetical protein
MLYSCVLVSIDLGIATLNQHTPFWLRQSRQAVTLERRFRMYHDFVNGVLEDKAHARGRYHDCLPHDGSRVAPPLRGEAHCGWGTWRMAIASALHWDGFLRLTDATVPNHDACQPFNITCIQGCRI